MAQREIGIVSPFLSATALLDDSLPPLLSNAIARGVSISVYTDEKLNEDNKKILKPHFVKAKQILIESGVKVILTKRIHNKTMWVDNDLIIEGSYNWLSAVRKPNSPWCRYETSIMYRGDGVNEMIQSVYSDLESRKFEEKVHAY